MEDWQSRLLYRGVLCAATRGITTIAVVPLLNLRIAWRGNPFGQRYTTVGTDWVFVPFVHVAEVLTAEWPKKLSLPPLKVAVHCDPSGSWAEN